ncbi:MAG: hypothetical protein H6712_12240 [Myxococcales bacterium]|nr:hypothetical protein [Myxococcales bacterium]
MPSWPQRLTTHRRWIPLVAMLMCAPALLGGLELDDLFHALHAGDPGFLGSAFTFYGDGPRPAFVSAADQPWWTEPGMRLDLLRPLAALTHWLDFRLWPGAPWLMHLHSLLWYGLLVALVGRAQRVLGGSPERASLAALLFGLAQIHGMNVGWIAARNSLMGAALVLGALLLHRRWRAEGWGLGALLGPLAFGGALLSNEGAVAGLGLLAAYALVLDGQRSRFVALLPYLILVIAWRVGYETAGYGAAHTGIYLDPATDPLAYGLRTIVNGAVMLAACLGLGVLDGLGALPGATLVAFVGAVPFLALLAWLTRDALRDDPSLRMWTLGAGLSCVTAGTSVPTDRGLLLMSAATSALLAALVLRAREPAASRLARVVGRGLLVLHLLLALLLPLRVGTTRWIHGRVEAIADALAGPPGSPAIAEQTVVLLNAPSDLVMLYSRAIAQRDGRPFPARVEYLYAGAGELTVHRATEHTLELESTRPWLVAPLDRMLRSDLAFAPGQRFERPCLTAEIVATSPDSLPTRVRVDLHVQRPGCRLRAMIWRGEVPEPAELPALGSSMVLAPITVP